MIYDPCPQCGETGKPLMFSEPQRGLMSDAYEIVPDPFDGGLWHGYCASCGTYLGEFLAAIVS